MTDDGEGKFEIPTTNHYLLITDSRSPITADLNLRVSPLSAGNLIKKTNFIY
jgi:hypothetical protein